MNFSTTASTILFPSTENFIQDLFFMEIRRSLNRKRATPAEMEKDLLGRIEKWNREVDASNMKGQPKLSLNFVPCRFGEAKFQIVDETNGTTFCEVILYTSVMIFEE